MPRRAPVMETRLPAEGRREHALDPRDCTCDEGACIAAAIERTSAIDAPGLARCERAKGERPRAAGESPKGGR